MNYYIHTKASEDGQVIIIGKSMQCTGDDQLMGNTQLQ
jgi:hypothetical protein